MIGLIGMAVFGVALVGFVIVLDTNLVVRAVDRSRSLLIPVLVGTSAALGTVLAAIWYRRRVEHLGGTVRRMLGWAGIGWAVLFVVAFVWTHPKHRNDEHATSLEVAVISYVLVIIAAAVALLPVAVLSLSRPTTHRPGDRVRVWHIRDKKPYFVAYCGCGWVGTTHDATETHARDNAFRDARRHGTNVAPEVEHPLD